MRRTWTRREFGRMAAGAAAGGLGASVLSASSRAGASGGADPFRLWVMGNANLETEMFELEDRGRVELADPRMSLAEALKQSESDKGFAWDAALILGDLSGGRADKREARELQRQMGALEKHPREAIYCLAGDKDATERNTWFERWVDPLGRKPELSLVRTDRRPFPISGEWERYKFRVGNLVFLMLSDRNDVRPPMGRGKFGKGAFAAGATTMQSYLWWREAVKEHADDIVVSAHHHMLRETTFGTGDWEAFRGEEGSRESYLQPWTDEEGEHNKGAGYLYWTLDDRYSPATQAPSAMNFTTSLREAPGCIDMWLGCHNPAAPDAVLNGRGQIARKYDVNFVSCGTLARRHVATTEAPWSRLFTFTDGSDQVRVQTYLHTDELAPQGFHAPFETTLTLSKPFRRA